MPTTLEIFVPLSDIPLAGEAGAGAEPGLAPDPLTATALHRAARIAGIPEADLLGGQILRKALDARKGFPLGYRLAVQLFRKHEQPTALLSSQASQAGAGPSDSADPQGLPPPRRARPGLRVAIVGSGPAGTFAALRLSAAGAQVIVLEQGKPVQPRRRDLALLTRGQLNPTSNYCFGEGGAGTFSDGKLYTRTKDKAAVRETLLVLVHHGADPQIAVESRPHIGSNRLPQILSALREDLIRRGVEYLFEETVSDLLVSAMQPDRLAGVRCASGREVAADAVVLCVGHSARPMYQILVRRGVALVPKAFAVGVRIEHPQPLIDEIQYGRAAGHPALPAAFYHLTASCAGRGVYSFCMCPGGWVVPSSTEDQGICVNGMSLSRRDSPFANSALVVSVEPTDFGAILASAGGAGDDPLAGVAFQRELEQRAFRLGGGGFVSPAQRLDDFLAGRPSSEALPSTYRPHVVPGDLGGLLPDFVSGPLREAIRRFQRTMPGFLTPRAQLVGVETRTSAPVRILRDESRQSPTMVGLYPCGEGAGYAGGIVSAAIDGLRTADAIIA